MAVQKMLKPNFAVSVRVTFIPEESKPEQNFYFFSYQILIENKGNFTAQLLSRHWIITDAFGQVEEVRGPGVVGLQPKIQSGKSFSYDSACPIPTTSGTMRGFYQMISDDGQTFEIEIPEFYLLAPSAIH